MNKTIKASSVAIFLLFLYTATLVALPAISVETVNDRDYFTKVHKLLKNANKSIYLIMYSAHYYDKYPNSPSNLLLKDLAHSKKRGVNVKVILEQNYSTKKGFIKRKKKIEPQQHERVVEFLEKYKIPYILDSPEISTHSKLIIVDGLYTVIGSTNWSYSAIEKNHETSVIIKSKEVATEYMDYFSKIKEH